LASFALDYARQGILSGTSGQAAYAEVGGVKEAKFVRGSIAEEEHSADFVSRQAVIEFAGFASGADAGDVDVDVGGIVGGVPSPKEASRHEFRAGALGFPGVPMIDLSGALADGLSEPAVDGAGGIVAQFEVEPALREIGVRVAHGFVEGSG